ncbi:SDR family oxidoreductase [Mycetocola reblochoni]|uniref:Short chain dehydrogenase n=2 Tax=Mycetocola reblochoni TaxID=331618 RepID=A0A1R4IVL9_9MICO|nr:SDR family oxidoreductase [Mycetocola reblochoni]RLP70991.1 SDR family oxidoreductase [Mycetocola reblochoni]SJN23882.1 short chain dehydrogenase [Mycetocola reblochoni REB411]
MTAQTILITGAGSGFGRELALQLAESGRRVIAGVEIVAQVAELEEHASRRGVHLTIEKLDVTDPADRERVRGWDIDVLVNNAGISEGGSVADIPEEALRRQFEVNVIGPAALTRDVARRMARRRSGSIVFMSSVAGLSTDPFAGAYSASKHAVEALASALRAELAEFGVRVATVNPGPYLTGFNDRMFESWRRWRDEPSDRLFDYERIAFPHAQYDPAIAVRDALPVITGESAAYRTVTPAEFAAGVKEQQEGEWGRRTDGPAQRDELVQTAYNMEPGTPVAPGGANAG